MSSIHYKFKATLEYKTLAFDGLSILAADLKRDICVKENIKAEAFDLILQNAHTKRQYMADEQVPRNSSIIVQRVPKEDGEKLPKIQGVNTGMVQRTDVSSDSGMNVTGHIMQSEFDKLSEEERLSHIKNVSTQKYDSIHYQKRPTGALTGPPPPTYTCNRCHQPGHWFKNCPLLNQKRTTGIPSQELMETTADDPQAMLHPSGKYVIPIMHWRARQHKKNVEETPVVEKVPPKELICPLCQHLFKDAVVTTCCGTSFCADCITQRLLESEERHCPGDNCNKSQVSVDSLVPNKMLRQMVATWEGGSSNEGHERIRIGLAPSSIQRNTTTINNAGLSPASAQVIPQPNIPMVQPTQPVVPSMSIPPPTIAVPATFTQPPPNMIMMTPADPLAPPGTSPMVSSFSTGHVTTYPSSQFTVPPIPGVSMMGDMYNRPAVSINNDPQFMDAWNAYLKRNDKPLRGRDDRRRKRSRGRRRSRSASEERKRSRRTRDERREKSKDRSKRRDYESKDSKRASYKSGTTKEVSEKEGRRKGDKREDGSPESTPKEEEKIEEPMDEEAAIDDALKEVEELKMFNKSENGITNDVDMEFNISKTAEEEVPDAEIIKKETNSVLNSPEAQKFSEAESTHSQKTTITSKTETSGDRSSDSESAHEKMDQYKDDDHNKSEHDDSEHNDEEGHKSDEKEKHKKEKKAKKHKKEKKHKKDRSETEEERRERKRLKKEKKEKKKRGKEEKDRMKEKEKERKDKKRDKNYSDSEDERHSYRRQSDKHKEKNDKDARYKDEKRRESHKDKDRQRHSEKERSSKHSKDRDRADEKKEDTLKEKDENSRDRSQKDKRSSKLDRLVDSKSGFSSKAAVVDEKRIREHFSPPPSLLQTKKITLNI